MSSILFLFICFMVLILFYKAFIDMALFTECIKLYYYISHNKIYYIFNKYFTLEYLTDFLVDLEIALEYTTIMEDIFENDTNYIYFHNAKLVRNNLTLWNYLRNTGQKYLFPWIIFKLLRNILMNYSTNLYRIYLLPQTIIIIIGCVELFNGTIHYFYYGLPIILLINILGQYYMFLRNKDGMLDGTVYRYFYGKHNTYKQIRSHFISNHDLISEETFTNIEARSMKEQYDNGELLAYISSYFKQEQMQTLTYINSRYKIRREQIIILLSFIIYNYGSVNTTMLYFILLVMYYLSRKIFNYKENTSITNRIYTIIFWVIFFIELALIYILILQAKLTFMNTDVLWDYGVTIRHTYNIEEKITYFWEYFDYVMKKGLLLEEYESLKHILLQTNIAEEVKQKETLKDIKQFVYDLYGAYVYREWMQWELIRYCLIEDYIIQYNKEYDARVKDKEELMCWIKNIVILTAFSKFFVAYVQAYHATTDSHLREQLAQWIVDMIVKMLRK